MSARDFTLLWSASAASQLGHMCSLTANPLLALLLTDSPVVAGWVGAASTVPALLMNLPAGWFVDRFNRRTLMFVGQAGRLAACLLPVPALVFRDHAAALLIASALLEAAFLVLYNTAEITAVQHVVPPSRLSKALVTNEARSHLALLAGRPLGGLLFGYGKALPYLMGVLASVWSIFALSMMDGKNYRPHPEEREGTRNPEAGFQGFFLSFKMVLLSPFLRTAVVVCTVGNFFFQTVVLALIVLAREQNMPSADIGLLLATSGVGGLVGSVIAPKIGKRLRDERKIIQGCVVAWAALILVVAVSDLPAVGLIAWGGLSVTGGFLNVALLIHQTGRVPRHMLGRVMGINRFFTSGAVPLGTMCAGYIIAGLRPDGAVWLAFAAMSAMALAVPVLLRPRTMLPDRAIDRLKKRLTRSSPPGAPTAEMINESPLDFLPAR